MLTLEDLLMGRDKTHPKDFTIEIKTQGEDLVRRVNNLFTALQLRVPPVTSGWRPLEINMRAGGAKRSLHMQCKAVDLSDPKGEVKKAIMKKTELLLDFGLWLESPDSTPTWVHLDTGIRSARLVQVFKP